MNRLRFHKTLFPTASWSQGPVRWLHLQEYQSKELMKAYGLNTQKFIVVSEATGVAIKVKTLLSTQ